jgi:hypothetical protein
MSRALDVLGLIAGLLIALIFGRGGVGGNGDAIPPPPPPPDRG